MLVIFIFQKKWTLNLFTKIFLKKKYNTLNSCNIYSERNGHENLFTKILFIVRD